MIHRFCRAALAGPLLVLLLAVTPAQAAISIVFDFSGDGANEGFNDATLGAQRKAVMEAAGQHLGSFFDPSYVGEVWRIAATFDPLGPKFIGSASPTSFVAGGDFVGGNSNFAYASTLANHLNKATIATGNTVTAQFNSTTTFDFSTTMSPGAGLESLFSTAVHEICHGLGFLNAVGTASGAWDEMPLFGTTDVFIGPTVFDSKLALGNGTMFTSLTTDAERAAALTGDNLFFTGANAMAANPLGAGPAKILAPSPFEGGSTGAHFDRIAFGGIGDLMLPEASSQVAEPIFLSAMDAGVLYDIGYTRAVSAVPEPSTWAALAIGLGGLVARRRHKRTNANQAGMAA